MPMVLHCNAKYLESVHPQGSDFDSGLVLKNQIHRSGEQTDEGIPLRSCQEDLAKLDLQYLAHCL